ncbi:MAG TPA: prepilin-type N-terminal cleavage/methylation domain-containing protein [Candidatus Saccharimonadales bacterium]
MAGKNTNRPHVAGFTIVELLIVIVVVGILATLVMSAFQNMQAKARDSIRKQDLANIKKSILNQNNVNGTWARAGDNCATNTRADGFLTLRGMSATGVNYGAKSMTDCLIEDGFLSADIVDPSGARSCPTSTTPTCRTYMKVQCTVSGQTRVYLYASLETEPTGTTLTEQCSLAATWDSNFGMNYALQVL